MNILQILPALDVGGVETGTVDLARYLVRNGHKAIVVSSGGRLVRELDAAGSRHYTLPVGKKSVFNILRMIREVSDIIRNEDIDIVHARSRVPALIAFFACRITGRVFITTAHGHYKKHPLSEVMGWGRYVIVASNIMAKHMASDFGVPRERIRLIPRGVDVQRFKFRDPVSWHPKGFTVGMVSRITPLKGHADFIKAVSILNRKIPQLKALIVGEAPKEKYKEELELLVRRLGLHRTIEFSGARHDIPKVMEDLDLLVSATVTPEAFGRVIIEAQASGVPVVATRVGGVVDIIEDGKNGLLTSALNPKDMAEKMYRLYSDRASWIKLALEGRKNVEGHYALSDMMTGTVAVYEEALKTKNILVIKMSALGDVILSIPSLRAIRSRFPDARIKVLVGRESREALNGCPYIDDKIVCDLKGRDRGIGGLLRLGGELRKNCFDIVIDLQNSKKSHVLAFLSYGPLRYGYDNRKFSFLLNRRIKDDAPYLDPIEHQFRVLKLAGIKPDNKTLELWPSEADEKRIEELFKESWTSPGSRIVGIHVRASSRWLSKNWPPAYISELCDRLAKEFNIRVVLTGNRGDEDIAAQVSRMARTKPVIAAGKTDILELASLIRKCAVYVTPDSAPMHIASAVGTPFVALFGPTDPVRHTPPSKDCAVICRSDEVKCSPCYSPRCAKNFRCMKKITVDEVFGAVKKFLERSGQ
ncbi:MAG: lipopolysaccharide heptosyltransferase II [Candidatus Omnitrophota bacterium]